MKSFIYPLFVVICDRKSSETHKVAITDGPNGVVLEQFQMIVTRWNGLKYFINTKCVIRLFFSKLQKNVDSLFGSFIWTRTEMDASGRNDRAL